MWATPEHSWKSHVAPLNGSLIDVCVGSSQTEMYLMEGTQEKPILLIIASHCFTRTNILCGITKAESLTRHYNCRKWSSVEKNGDERIITGWLLEALDGAVSINSSLTTIRGKLSGFQNSWLDISLEWLSVKNFSCTYLNIKQHTSPKLSGGTFSFGKMLCTEILLNQKLSSKSL